MTPAALKEIRITLCFSQADLARALDLTPTAISLYEHGKRKPSTGTIRKFVEFANSKGVNISYKDFLEDESINKESK